MQEDSVTKSIKGGNTREIVVCGGRGVPFVIW